MTAQEWLADIGKAADELGFHVESIDYRRVRLVPMYGGSEITVEIESVLLGGGIMRSLLKKQEKPERKP